MESIDQSRLYIGKEAYLDLSDLKTHVFICGATGSGKTVMGKILIEEVLMREIPVIAFDLKGDVYSLAIPYEFYNDQMFEKLKLGSYEDYKKKLQAWGFAEEDVKKFKERLNVRIYSPSGTNGVSLGYSPIPKKPEDPETYHEMLNFAASNVVSLLDPGKNLNIEEALIQSLIEFFWKSGEELYGVDGLKKLINAIVNPPIEKVGIMNIEEFIPKKRRIQLANMLNAKLVSYNQFFQGVDASDVELLVGEGRSLTIIDVSSLTNFETLSQIVGTVLFGIYSWMKRKGESERLRLIVFIDEIGGGGGKSSLLPSDPFQVPSKTPMRLLIRQGRAFGVGMILATQNPADVDYRSLSNCLTWFVGKLNRKNDRKKVLEGIVNSFEKDFSDFESDVNSLTPGKIILVKKTGDYVVFQQRWLLTPHKTLSKAQKEIIYSYYNQDSQNHDEYMQDEESPDEMVKDTEKLVDDFEPQLQQISDESSVERIEQFEKPTDEKIVELLDGVVEKLYVDVEQKMRLLRSIRDEFENKYSEMRSKLMEIVRIDIKGKLSYMENFSKDELRAVFDGLYIKKGVFGVKEYKAKTIKESLEIVLDVYQEVINHMYEVISGYGIKEEKIDIKEDFEKLLKNLKEEVFNMRQKKKMKERIFSEVSGFFNRVFGAMEDMLKVFKESFESYYEEKIERLKSIKGEIQETYDDIIDSLQHLKEIEKEIKSVGVGIYLRK